MEQIETPKLAQSVRWGEHYVSRALNLKTAGIIPKGIYHGFRLKPGGAMSVFVDHDIDYPRSVAVVERDGYSLTILMDDPGYVQIPAPGDWFIVIEAFYVESRPGYQRLVARETPESHHVILGKVSVPKDANAGTFITAAMISEDNRQTGQDITNISLDQISGIVEDLRHNQESVWTLTQAVKANGILKLPADCAYVPEKHLIELDWDGLACFPGKQFTEVSESDEIESTSIKLLFDAPVGSEFRVRIYPYSLGDTLSTALPLDNLKARLAALEDQISKLSSAVPYIKGVDDNAE